jgi:DDE superfamily endonuclease
VFIGVAGPGIIGNREAINEVGLGRLIESLPGTYCAIGDCAYTPSEHLVPIYRGVNATLPRNDNFNYFASQLRIRIEMAFGLMVKKWEILERPLSFKLTNLKKIVVGMGVVHNFCINERLLEKNNDKHLYRPHDVDLTAAYSQVREAASNYRTPDTPTNIIGYSHNRENMADFIESLMLD